MSKSSDHLIFYHGTDLDSALDILNNGLAPQPLMLLQSGRSVHLGQGWYTSLDSEVAWFFAPLAPGNIGRGYTVVQMTLSKNDFKVLVDKNLVVKSQIMNVMFIAEEHRFDPSSFDFLNAKAIFRPHKRGD